MRAKKKMSAEKNWPIEETSIDQSFANGQSRDRTGDTRIFSPVLYQLSYPPEASEGV